VRLTIVAALLVAAAACPGSGSVQPRVDGPRGEAPMFSDGLPRTERAGDAANAGEGLLKLDGSPPTSCTAKTGDGIDLNPGCDPDFQTKGPTAAGEFQDPKTKNKGWLLTTGPKWWLFDPAAAGGKGSFTSGGKDLAAMILAGMEPTSCTPTWADGTPQNPGCDVGFKANGPTAVSEFTSPQTKSAAWLFTAGKKWWAFDPVAGKFTFGGAAIDAVFASWQPACPSALNPACDPAVQVNGVSAAGEFRSAGGAPAWLFTAGKKWWAFDPAAAPSGRFAFGGESIDTLLATFQPGCPSALNPGCDLDVKANGLTTVGEIRAGGGGQNLWFMTAGKKWWVFDPATGGGKGSFIGGGADFAAFCRTLLP
jgi:hypothetical protein